MITDAELSTLERLLSSPPHCHALTVDAGQLRALIERTRRAEEKAEELHVFTDDECFIVARDVDDAWEIFLKLSGGSREAYEADGVEFRQLPAEKFIEIRYETTCGQWARMHGRGYLAGDG